MFIRNKIHGLFEYIGIVSTIFDVVVLVDLSNKSNIPNQTFFLLKKDIKYSPTSSIYHISMLIFLWPLWFYVKLFYLIFHVLHVL